MSYFYILKLKCTKFDFGWVSAPDPTGGAYRVKPQTRLNPTLGCIRIHKRLFHMNAANTSLAFKCTCTRQTSTRRHNTRMYTDSCVSCQSEWHCPHLLLRIHAAAVPLLLGTQCRTTIDRYRQPGGRSAANPPHAAAPVDRWDRPTDGHTPDRFLDPAPARVGGVA